MVRVIAPAAAVAAITLAIAAVGGGHPGSAQTDPIVGVDAVSDAANTATAVGPIDGCLSTTTGATFDVDVVIQGVTNISGFQANLLYDPGALKVTAVDYSFLLATTGASVLDLGNTPPDTDGDFLAAAVMFSFISVTGASGDGVLARVTFQAVGSGSSDLDLTSVKLSDANGSPIPPVDVSNFYIGPTNDGSASIDTPWAVPLGDSDCDGWTTSDENPVGTDPNVACPITSVARDEEPDAWPPDFDDSRTVNINDLLGDPVSFKNSFGATDPDPLYFARFDLSMDGTINVNDLLGVPNSFKSVFGLSCTP